MTRAKEEPEQPEELDKPDAPDTPDGLLDRDAPEGPAEEEEEGEYAAVLARQSMTIGYPVICR